MMRETGSRLRVAERVAGVIAVVAALVVLNGAWENQHNWQNVSWRAAMALILFVLAAVVESDAFGLQRPRGADAEAALPDFLRADQQLPVDSAASPAEADGVPAGTRAPR